MRRSINVLSRLRRPQIYSKHVSKVYCQRPFSSTFDADKARQTAADALKLVNKGKDTEKPENTNVSAAESTTTSEPQASIAPETRDMYTSARPSTSGESVQRDSASRSASASDTFDDGDDEDDGEEERRVSKEELIEEMIRASHAAEVAALSFQQGQLWMSGSSSSRARLQGLCEETSEHVRQLREDIHEKRVRPSLTLPLMSCGSYVAGSASYLLGESLNKQLKEGMALALSEHYNDQVREIVEKFGGETALKESFKQYRNEMEDRIEGHREIDMSENGAPKSDLPSLPTPRDAAKQITKLALWLTAKV